MKRLIAPVLKWLAVARRLVTSLPLVMIQGIVWLERRDEMSAIMFGLAVFTNTAVISLANNTWLKRGCLKVGHFLGVSPRTTALQFSPQPQPRPARLARVARRCRTWQA